jgi:thiamine-phosphate pyrophosphorylase
MKLRGLYAVTPELADGELLLSNVARALEGGIAMLQYRNKGRQDLGQDRARAVEARALAALCRRAGVPFIVNDDLELALACDADGLHLGREDGPLAVARGRLGTKLLGASCYDSFAAARAAVAAGADYVAFGSVFPSPTKPSAVRAPHSLFGEARTLGVPLVAIGGITLENAPQLLQAGADGLAVVSGLFDAPDIAARARAYGKLFAT